jgi:predicted DNA binding CopG/RHH family protein
MKGIHATGCYMEKQVKINLGVAESVSKGLKEVARSKGMKFHAYLAIEMQKLLTKEQRKLSND